MCSHFVKLSLILAVVPNLIASNVLPENGDYAPEEVEMGLFNFNFAIEDYIIVNRCSSWERELMNRCEADAREDWDVRDIDYVSLLLLILTQPTLLFRPSILKLRKKICC